MAKKKDQSRIGYRNLGCGFFRIRVEPELTDNPQFMAGTTGTGQYQVIATSPAGAEQIGAVLTPETGWKQPGEDDQNRWSIVTLGKTEFDEALKQALQAMGLKLEDIDPGILPQVQEADPVDEEL